MSTSPLKAAKCRGANSLELEAFKLQHFWIRIRMERVSWQILNSLLVKVPTKENVNGPMTSLGTKPGSVKMIADVSPIKQVKILQESQ